MCIAKIICPVCSCPVNIKKFGDGWVGTCCQEIIYNSELPPADIPDGSDDLGKSFMGRNPHKNKKLYQSIMKSVIAEKTPEMLARNLF